MKNHLVLALALAALALVVLGARVGLGPAAARAAIAGILALAILAQALISATSRLPEFLDGGRENRFAKSLAAQAALILAALWASGIGSLRATGFVAFLAGYLAVLTLLPRAALTSLAEPGEPAPAAAAARLALRFAGALAALALVLALFPGFAAGLPLPPELPRSIVPWVAAGALALPLLLGGQKAAGRLAAQLMLIAAAAILAPLGFDLAGDILNGRAAAEHAEAALALWQAGPADFGPADMRLAAFGAAAALVAGANHAHLPARLPRFGAGLFAAALAGALLAAGALGLSQIASIVAGEIAGRQPPLWPVFAFDEAVAGWLTVCGMRPADALDVAQACRLAGIALPPPAEAIAIEPRLAFEALALSRGWPAVLGTLWRLAEPLLGFAALGLLVHAAATAFSEIVLYRVARPRALKAGRLALARFSVLALLGLAATAAAAEWRPDSGLIAVAMLGSALSAAAMLLAGLLAALARALHRRRRVMPAPA